MALSKEQLKAAQASAVERKEPRFVTFGVGEFIDGVLLKLEPGVQITDKQTGRVSRAIRYTMETPSGELVCFLGTYQIDTKLHRGDIGKYVAIRYEGDNKEVSRNGNSMKEFKVIVAEIPGVTNLHGLEVTDDDVPQFLK